MAKSKKSGLSETLRRVIMLVLGGVCSALVLAFSVLTIITVTQNNYSEAPKYLTWVFISMALNSFIYLLKNRNKANLIRCLLLFTFNIALGIIVLFAKNNMYLFSLTAGLYCLNVIISRVIDIVIKKTIRAIIFNGIIILLAALLSVGLFIPVDASGIDAVILVECMFIAITAFAEVAMVAFGQLKFKVLLQIIIKTFALEVLFGLAAVIIASSLVLLTVEDAFTTFADALWYCFAVVTTIGFGDFVATTTVGRLITVLLGIYGIIAVAVITSIIVNFYNETSGKKDAKELRNIQKDDD